MLYGGVITSNRPYPFLYTVPGLICFDSAPSPAGTAFAAFKYCVDGSTALYAYVAFETVLEVLRLKFWSMPT